MNFAVDLGWFGDSWLNLDGVYDIPTMDAYFVDIRTRIYDEFLLDDGANNWDVSPLFKWTTTGDVAYGIVIKRLVAGSPDGREWFIPFMGMQDAINASNPDVVFQSNALATQFFRRTNDLDGSAGFGNGGVGLHYHTGGLSTTYDLTGVAVDLDPPTTTPGASMAAFMPVHATVPHIPGPLLFNSIALTNRSKWCLVFNHTVPFVGLYFCDAGDKDGITHLGVAGDIVVPRDIADTHKDGSFCMSIDTNGLDTRLPESLVLIGYLTDTGVPVIQSNLDVHGQFSPYNSPNDAQGEAYSDALSLVHDASTTTEGPSFVKGLIRKDVIAEQGWNNAQHYRMFDSKYGKQLKVGDTITVPWVTSPEPPPFAGWPINPQDVP